MNTIQELLHMVDQQEETAAKLRKEVRRLGEMDFLSQNEALRQQLEKNRAKAGKLEALANDLEKENRRLKDALVGHAYQKKQDFAKQSWSRLTAEGQRTGGEFLAELSQMEQRYRETIQAMRTELSQWNRQGAAMLAEKITACERELDAFVQQQRTNLNTHQGQMFNEASGRYEEYEKRPLTEAQIQRKAEQDNMEFRVGSRVVNLVGVLLVVIGVIAGLQYTYTYLLTDPLKSAAAYLLGFAFLAGGELASRKKKSPFSLGITAGGIAILFAATVVSYFVLNVLSVFAAFALCILVVVVALLLSLRYSSQVIANFALIGGFLPVYAVSFGDVRILYSLIVYLVVLNFFTMYISNRRDWGSVKYFSLGFNTLCTLYIVMAGGGGWLLSLAYVTLNFIMYVFIVILHPMRSKKPMDEGSLAVAVLNSLLNCAFVFGILHFGDLGQWMGLTALVLAAFYFGFSKYLARYMPGNQLHQLFLCTSLVFAVLVIPLQFDTRWLAVGWLCEAAALIAAGMLTKEKLYRAIGGITYGLCVCSFLLFDVRILFTSLFLMKFTAIVLVTVALFVFALYTHRAEKSYLYTREGTVLRTIKHYLMVLIYAYLLYIICHFIYSLSGRLLVLDFLTLALAVSSLYGLVLRSIPRFKDRVTEAAASILFCCGFLVTLILNMTHPGHLVTLMPLPVSFVIVNVAGAFCVWQELRLLVQHGRLDPDRQPMLLFSYLLVVVLQMMMVQARLPFSHMLLSLVLICAAVIYVIHGFVARTASTRRVGLVLSLATVIKFFLVDLSFLRDWQRIVSYFVLGIMLIAISFVYQHFSKRVFSLEDVQLPAGKPGETKDDPPEQAG